MYRGCLRYFEGLGAGRAVAGHPGAPERSAVGPVTAPDGPETAPRRRGRGSETPDNGVHRGGSELVRTSSWYGPVFANLVGGPHDRNGQYGSAEGLSGWPNSLGQSLLDDHWHFALPQGASKPVPRGFRQTDVE